MTKCNYRSAPEEEDEQFLDPSLAQNSLFKNVTEESIGQILVCSGAKMHTYKKNEIVEDPQMLAWQKVIDNSVGNKEFTLGNALTKAVDVEQKIYKREILGEAGKPVSEEEAEKEESGVTNDGVSNNEDSVEAVRKRIINMIKQMTPPEKQEMKDKLVKEGLPTTITRIKDLGQLKKIEEVLS